MLAALEFVVLWDAELLGRVGWSVARSGSVAAAQVVQRLPRLRRKVAADVLLPQLQHEGVEDVPVVLCYCSRIFVVGLYEACQLCGAC